jgi:DNA repair protein RadD
VLQLRPYQTQAIGALFDYWATEPGNPLIDLATGTGKSLVMATVVQRLLDGWPDMRIAIVTHVAELIEQNFQELVNLWPWAPAGILSAGLGQRNTHAQILFAGIQTAHNKVDRIGHVDVLMVDEAHLIPPKANTMYGRFIADLRAINPDMKIVGLTATPFRLGSGRLDEGDDRLFDKVVYTYGIADGIRDGYLSPLTSKGMTTSFDLSGVAKKGGDYVPGALQSAVDKDEVTEAAVSEIIGYGRDRRSWMAFCSGVEHATHVRDAIRRRGFTAEVVTGETPKDERRRIIEGFKAGRIRCLTNNSVLTTGFNAPGVDLIAALRPTLSPSLYVQAVGRGTRLAPGKTNCLVLDFAGWVRTHGPVDDVRARRPGKGRGEAPIKVCPDCHSLVHASARQCSDCGHEFEFEEKPKHKATADSAPILSSAEPEWLTVTGRRFAYHDKPGGTDSICVHLGCGLVTHKMWVCPEHKGFAKQKADRFWMQHGGAAPAPKSVQEWLDRAGELQPTAEISVRPNGRYFEVVGVRPALEMREAA